MLNSNSSIPRWLKQYYVLILFLSCFIIFMLCSCMDFIIYYLTFAGCIDFKFCYSHSDVTPHCSQQSVQMPPVTIEQGGYCFARRASLLIGRGSECRRHPKRYLRALFLGHWMLFFVMRSWNRPGLVTREISLAPNFLELV